MPQRGLLWSVLVLALCLGCVVEEVVCQTELTADDKLEILNAHNNFRGMVTPTAANMERMVSNCDSLVFS